MDERELEGIKREMEKLAEHLEGFGDEIDTDVVAGILRELAAGHTAETIIKEYGLIDSGI